MHVLIIDDSDDFRNSLKTKFQGRDQCTITEVASMQELFSNDRIIENVDVVVLDLDLGTYNENGEDILRKFKQIWNTSCRPAVVIVTTHPERMARNTIHDGELPIDSFYTKDVPNSCICQTIERLFEERKETKSPETDGIFSDNLIVKIINYGDPSKRTDLQGETKQVLSLIYSWVYEANVTAGRTRERLFNSILRFYNSTEALKLISQDLLSILQRSPNVERALYRVPEYREHLIHQMQVFLLGYAILMDIHASQNLELKNTFEKDTSLDFGHTIGCWYQASAFHDLAYPFQKMKVWLNSFFKEMLVPTVDIDKSCGIASIFNWGEILLHDKYLRSFNLLVADICSTFEVPEEKKDKIQYIIAQFIIEKPNHAVLGALLLLHSEKTSDEIRKVAVAICLHDIEVAKRVRDCVGKKLTFSQAPLACLLAFCDMVQEWGRVKPSTAPQTPSEFGVPVFHSLRYDGEKIRLELCYPNLHRNQVSDWQEKVFKKHIEPLANCWYARGLFEAAYYRKIEDARGNISMETEPFETLLI